jgi:glycosyltransferase involved in cell wall biosynthesis
VSEPGGAPRLLHVFATFAPGGPQVRTARLMNAFGGAYRHSVVSMDDRTDARELVDAGVPLEVLPTPPRRGSLATARAMRALLREHRPDLLLTYNWGSIDTALAGRTLGVRAWIHAEDGFLPDEAAGQKGRRVWMRRLLLRGASRVIVPSRNLERIATELWKLPPALVDWVPNGIDTADFPPADGNAELRAKLGIPADALVVGSVGHLRGEKNFARLLTAVARLGPQVHLLLVGDGDERPRLEKLSQAPLLAGRTHLAGHREQLGPWYRAMDVFAMSSDTEQMPVALLEAMSAALPVASTDVGDVRAMMPDAQAELVVPLGAGSVERLADALRSLADDPELRRRLGGANRARVEELFTFEAMVRAYEERYGAALARRRSA